METDMQPAPQGASFTRSCRFRKEQASPDSDSESELRPSRSFASCATQDASPQVLRNHPEIQLISTSLKKGANPFQYSVFLLKYSQ